jgi:hypothetical protein
MGMVKYIVVILLLIPTLSWADTHTIANCNRETIMTALSSVSDGDTIQVPPGDCTFTSAVPVDLTSPSSKGITIMGSGNGNNSEVDTIITNYGFNVTGADGKAWRITNMRLKGTTTGNAIISVSGQSKTWRIDNIYFDTLSAKAVWVQANGGATAYTTGVIDSCTFYHPGGISVHVRGNTSVWGNETWNRTLGLGTSDAVYIENNTFIEDINSTLNWVVDCDGANYVFRYNSVTNTGLGMHDAIIAGSSGIRGCRKWEAYNNYFVVENTSKVWAGFNFRGGTGVIFNNKWNGAPEGGLIQTATYRYYQTSSAPWDTLCNASSTNKARFGLLSGAKLCTSGDDCYAIDGAGGYPCRDQLGTSGGLSQSGGEAPALFWNNKYCSYNSEGCEATTNQAPIPRGGASTMVSGRDYCYANDTMPATCNGVETSYTPYTCPHPLADPSAQGSCDSSKVGTEGYTLTGGESDETAPTVLSVYVNGATMTINFSEAITSADNAAFTLDPSGADVTVDCPAVATAATSMTCTISRALVQSETATYAYSDTKVIDAASNALANIGATAITGNLTPAEAPTSKLTVNKTGSGCTVTSSPSGISFGGATASDDFDFNTGTAVTLSGYSENGWNAITYGGDCASNGTVTMSANKTCTATCTQVLLFP